MKEEEQTVITDLMQLDIKKQAAPYAYFISRGAEMCDVSEGVCKCLFYFSDMESVYLLNHST
jgi:hypothetical protein